MLALRYAHKRPKCNKLLKSRTGFCVATTSLSTLDNNSHPKPIILTLKHPTFIIRRYGGQNRKQGRLLRQAQGPPRRIQVNLHRRRRQCQLSADARDPPCPPRSGCCPDGQEHYGQNLHYQNIKSETTNLFP